MRATSGDGAEDGAAEPPMRAAGGLVRRSTRRSISVSMAASPEDSGSLGIAPALSSKSESSAALAAGVGSGGGRDRRGRSLESGQRAGGAGAAAIG
jgi:hypothetical protein